MVRRSLLTVLLPTDLLVPELLPPPLCLFCFVELNHGHVVALCYSDLHPSFACLFFVFGIFSFVDLTHESPDLRGGEYCSSELSVDCLRVSYRTWAAWTLWVSCDWISSGDPGVGLRILIILGPGGLFLGNPWVLDPESSFSEPGIKVLKVPHPAILGEATLDTCWGITFYCSEAGHYQVPVLQAAFWRKPLSDLGGAGVGENPSARLCYFPRLEK
ncbi:hypothetical protein DY000_02022323 [Brassica cretica]|uniref:Uncharacterized protein n=1 Tax=Brassica cretica TaxID=69181 RepID=A0ABQ7EJ32_BRACR|nr:hypothetical protein DY000_02022323 [Brassica cretica]